MTTETIAHLHDLGITISAGDLTPELVDRVRAILEREVQAAVERTNVQMGRPVVGWYVSYDGSRECGEH